MAIDPTTWIRIKYQFKSFLDGRIRSIEKLTIWDFDLNPFFLACVKHQMKLESPHDLAKWLVSQRIERGMVTGFGKTLQNIAKEFSTEKPIPGLTMRLRKGNKIYNLMIKSGPNPYPMQPAKDMQNILLRTMDKEPNSIPIFCMCYGNEKAVSSIVKTYMNEVKHLVGNDFWTFISGDSHCEQKILKIAKEIGLNYKDKKGNTLDHIIERKVKQMEQQLKELYGNDQVFWKNILEGAY